MRERYGIRGGLETRSQNGWNRWGGGCVIGTELVIKNGYFTHKASPAVQNSAGTSVDLLNVIKVIIVILYSFVLLKQ